MRRYINRLSLLSLFAFLLFGSAATADAQRRNERETRDTLRSLNSKIDDFAFALDARLRSSSVNRGSRSDAENSIDRLREAVKTFGDNLDRKRENRTDINGIVAAAQDVSAYLDANPQNRRIGSTWDEVRGLIDRLAGSYGVSPDWSGRTSANDDIPYSSPIPAASYHRMSGTYSLDKNRSEDTADIIDGIQLSAENRRDLEGKLSSPDQIALRINGDNVTLASNLADPITFAADGSERSEQADGRTIRVRASLNGDRLTVSSLGGDTDYTIIFEPTGSGGMKVTKRITTPYLDETVFVDSIYNKTDEVARLGIEDIDDTYAANDDDGNWSSNDPNDRIGSSSPNPTLSKPRIGEFIIPNGEIISVVLDNEINTKISQNNDRFKMTVQSPDEFRGAVIEGYISGVGRSGQVSGRSNVTFNFERITLRNGREYDFSGYIHSIKDHAGKEVKINPEGTVQGDSQTKETAKRGGIGAGIGAVIGAIAGGGKGAILGAIIGGGAGAGSVIATGRDDVRLMPGSTITIQSSSPIRSANQ
ncbi:MAG: hypothetical protein KF855_07375 [Acidobacteria bacterium]|nr:hypothetical protein [Acidobacteriota bacterium]